MEYQRRVLKWGAGFIVLAAVLRLLSAGFFQQPGVASLLLYMETGRLIRFDGVAEALPEATEPPKAEAPEKKPLVFTEDEVIPVQNHTGYQPDLPALLTQPLSWAVSEGPTVLILHTHATETYTGADIAYSGAYRTKELAYNMVSIGAEVARVLTAGGIGVLHDQTLHDWPNYSIAYDAARETVAEYLRKYPSIRLVLDIHRDAAGGTGELVTAATVAGQRAAQLMLVVGTQSETWQENLSLALKVSALLERTDPGISRPIDLRKERFNMDLSVGSLLVEVGATGNTHEEALIAANALAQAVMELLMDNG